MSNLNFLINKYGNKYILDLKNKFMNLINALDNLNINDNNDFVKYLRITDRLFNLALTLPDGVSVDDILNFNGVKNE